MSQLTFAFADRYVSALNAVGWRIYRFHCSAEYLGYHRDSRRSLRRPSVEAVYRDALRLWHIDPESDLFRWEDDYREEAA